MRREPAAERARAALEQHVRNLLGVDGHDARRVAADLLQRAGEPFRLACELHGRSVGEALALARDACLDEAGEQHADAADDDQRHADRERRGDAAVVAAAAAAARVASAAQQPPADERQHENAEGEADQLLVEAHVAVQDVTDLVRDDALQLGSFEMLERAACHGDGGIAGRETGRKRVDARFLLEDVDLRNGQAGRQRHLLDDVDEAALERVVAFAGDARAAEHPRDMAAAARERRGTRQARHDHEPERAERDAEHEPAVAVEPLPPVLGAEKQRVVLGVQAQARGDHDRGRERDDDERQQERADERATRAARLLLAREEVHGLRAAELSC